MPAIRRRRTRRSLRANERLRTVSISNCRPGRVRAEFVPAARAANQIATIIIAFYLAQLCIMRNQMVTQEERPDVYRALADSTRRTILADLISGELSVNAIAVRFPVSRPAISKHLRLLREADLVSEHRRGKNRFYRLNPEPLREIDDYLEAYRKMWDSKLRSLKRHLESADRAERGGS